MADHTSTQQQTTGNTGSAATAIVDLEHPAVRRALLRAGRRRR